MDLLKRKKEMLLTIIKFVCLPHVTPGSGKAFGRSLLLGALAFGIALSLNLRLINSEYLFSVQDGHMNISFELATNRAMCGKTSHVSVDDQLSITTIMRNNLQNLDLSAKIMDIPSLYGGVSTSSIVTRSRSHSSARSTA